MQPQPADVLLHACSLIDGVSDEVLPSAAVYIRDGRVVECGPEAQVRAATPAGTRELDMDGAYVMPGLVNMHTHFSLSRTTLPSMREALA